MAVYHDVKTGIPAIYLQMSVIYTGPLYMPCETSRVTFVVYIRRVRVNKLKHHRLVVFWFHVIIETNVELLFLSNDGNIFQWNLT